MSQADPLLILAPHRSYTSVICAVLGQHPQLYGLPEMNLFVRETMPDWWLSFGRGTAIGAHGPLRAVAEIFWGEQTEKTIRWAWFWLRQRLQRSTGDVFQEMADQVAPRGVVDKSPTTVYRVEYMKRARRMFSRARFLHLLRHPLGHGQSVLKSLNDFDRFGALPHGLRDVLQNEMTSGARWQQGRNVPVNTSDKASLFDYSTDPPTIDPQMRWYHLHTNICNFLSTVPEDQWLRIAGEDLMADLDAYLYKIADWMGLRTDSEAIERMKHPEQSPYACFGPSNAHLGNDPYFLQNPVLDTTKSRTKHSLDGPLPWRKDGAGFRQEVRTLARQLGYT